jgi:hypothetical protein
MAAVIDDDLLEHFVVSGTFDEMPAKLVERYGVVADRVVLYFAVVARDDPGEALGRWGGIARGVARLSSA